jgi:hypothetical protein
MSDGWSATDAVVVSIEVPVDATAQLDRSELLLDKTVDVLVLGAVIVTGAVCAVGFSCRSGFRVRVGPAVLVGLQ